MPDPFVPLTRFLTIGAAIRVAVVATILFPVAIGIARVMTDVAPRVVPVMVLAGVVMTVVAVMAMMAVMNMAPVMPVVYMAAVIVSAAIVGTAIINILLAIDLLVAIMLVVIVVINRRDKHAAKKGAENRADGEVGVVGLRAVRRGDGDKGQGGHSGQKLSEHHLAPLVWMRIARVNMAFPSPHYAHNRHTNA